VSGVGNNCLLLCQQHCLQLLHQDVAVTALLRLWQMFILLFLTLLCCICDAYAGAHCIDCKQACSIYAVQAAVYDDEVPTCGSCGGLVKPGRLGTYLPACYSVAVQYLTVDSVCVQRAPLVGFALYPSAPWPMSRSGCALSHCALTCCHANFARMTPLSLVLRQFPCFSAPVAVQCHHADVLSCVVLLCCNARCCFCRHYLLW
jgi:hypothetical protein